MHIDQLRKQSSDDYACLLFFEPILCKRGRSCSHCHCLKSYLLSGTSVCRVLFECSLCKRQLTITAKTPMNTMKLPLWKWTLAMYLMSHFSKSISSVYLGKLIGFSLKSAWKLGHAIRQMMAMGSEVYLVLNAIVELNEKYGGVPRHAIRTGGSINDLKQ